LIFGEDRQSYYFDVTNLQDKKNDKFNIIKKEDCSSAYQNVEKELTKEPLTISKGNNIKNLNGTLLRNVDQEILIIALKGTEDELKDKIFSCMSQRASANIRDEMEVLGPLRLTEVQEAQKAIINVARTMSDEGTIVLAGRGGDDFV